MSRRVFIVFYPLLTSLFLFACQKELDEVLTDCDWIEEQTDFTTHVDPEGGNRKVLIIGIDGFRPDAMRADKTPFLYNFSLQSSTYFTNRNHVEYYSSTGPNWSSLLTGVHWCKHQVKKSNDYTDNRFQEFPHFFKYVEEADSSITTASFVRWTPINQNITQYYADYANFSGTSDMGVYNAAREMLINRAPIDPDILFLHFLDLDAAGHGFGFHPDVPEYAKAVALIDGYVSGLIAIIEKKRMNGEDWMIFIVSDHGGDGREHYDYSKDSNSHTIFFANHTFIPFTNSYISSQTDLVPTVLDFLGITSEEFNCKTDGVSLIN